MADLTETLLKLLKEKGEFESQDVGNLLNVDHQRIIGAIKSLETFDGVIKTEQKVTKRYELTDEGRQVAENGSHEAVVYKALPSEGLPQSELMSKVPNAKVGFSKAMSAGWISMDKKAAGGPRVFRKVDSIEDVVQQCCQQIEQIGLDKTTDQQKNDYKKRKLITEVKVTSYVVTKGPNFTVSVAKPATELTAEMIQTGSWKDKSFKAYNFSAMGVPPQSGHLHPLLKVRTQFRQIFLEMGFAEMPTNNYVESAFWNFDSLFQPQQHPARDAHDTFFVSEPCTANDFPMDYLKRVKAVHSEGGYGSQGYGYDWKIEEASKNIMRTHTTAVSSRMLYKLAQQETFKPAKFFSIDRVFRNENLDATHLAEFHQIEGLVADYGMTLGDLMGIIYEFFKKLGFGKYLKTNPSDKVGHLMIYPRGKSEQWSDWHKRYLTRFKSWFLARERWTLCDKGIEKLRFKPAYNPYTEPSMEIFSYHEGLKKWVEIGNSGVFRPEMLLPMGLPEDVSVIAWGLSLERPTMIKYGLNNIRELFGPKVNLQMVYDNPMCRLEK